MRTAGKRNGTRLSAARYRSKIKQESQFEPAGDFGKIANGSYTEWQRVLWSWLAMND